MSHGNRQETARDHVATIIQSARRGECTPHEAAGRVLALLGHPTPAPRSGLIAPLPCPATPSDKEDSPPSSSLLLSQVLSFAKALIEAAEFPQFDREETAKIKANWLSKLHAYEAPLPPVSGRIPPKPKGGTSSEEESVTLLAAARALIHAIRSRYPFLPSSDLHATPFGETRAFTALQHAVTVESAYILDAARDVVEAVEGAHAPRWAAGGLRLKDTPEWCAFYCAVNRAEREAEAPTPVPAPEPRSGCGEGEQKEEAPQSPGDDAIAT